MSYEEIQQLATLRKEKYKKEVFLPQQKRLNWTINPKYRSSLNEDGRWDYGQIPYDETLAFIAELLRLKRHEWFVYALADEDNCKLIWANKGWDNSSTFFNGNEIDVLDLAKKNNCCTVFCVHNHPHTQDRYWDLLRPSETDMEHDQRAALLFTQHGLNFIDAVCSQGSFMVYGCKLAPTFNPKGTTIAEVNKQNNRSEETNFQLHCELRQLRKKYGLR